MPHRSSHNPSEQVSGALDRLYGTQAPRFTSEWIFLTDWASAAAMAGGRPLIRWRFSFRSTSPGPSALPFSRLGKRFRLTPRDGERLPIGSHPVLCQQHDLPHMIRQMAQVPVERLTHRMRLGPDGDGATQI